ncbi:MAG: hypothetical protein JOZ41_17160, partial [Chloroflexi bacterium]|nr:hypothetical protein [Chloroflexota bacterium]
PLLGPEFSEPLSAEQRDDILALLRSEQTRLEERLPAVEDREARTLSADRARLSLPSAEAATRLLRYERAIHSQISRALADLERLQTRRTAGDDR